MLSSKKQSSFHKRTTFGIFTCCKILLRPETICEMNQKGEENRSQLPLSFLNKKLPKILQRTPLFSWEWLLELCVASILVQKKSLAVKLVQKGCLSRYRLIFSWENVRKVLLEDWRVMMMILALTNDHDFSFPCKWFSFESESGRRRCPCRARVFLGPMPPVIPFKASARCKNSDNLEFCILFPHVNVTKCK